MPCAVQRASEMAKMAKYCAVSTASGWLRGPSVQRSTTALARAIIQAAARRETAAMREMARLTAAAKSPRRCWLKREEKKGSEAAPAAWPRMLMGELKSVLATLRREMPPGSWEAKKLRIHLSALTSETPTMRGS